MSQNCLIIAGEKSGEEHCLSFFDTLRSSCPQMHFWGVGGDSLKKKGMELLYHLKDFSSMGFSEVLLKLPFYLNALKNIESEYKKPEQPKFKLGGSTVKDKMFEKLYKLHNEKH